MTKPICNLNTHLRTMESSCHSMDQSQEKTSFFDVLMSTVTSWISHRTKRLSLTFWGVPSLHGSVTGQNVFLWRSEEYRHSMDQSQDKTSFFDVPRSTVTPWISHRTKRLSLTFRGVPSLHGSVTGQNVFLWRSAEYRHSMDQSQDKTSFFDVLRSTVTPWISHRTKRLSLTFWGVPSLHGLVTGQNVFLWRYEEYRHSMDQSQDKTSFLNVLWSNVTSSLVFNFSKLFIKNKKIINNCVINKLL